MSNRDSAAFLFASQNNQKDVKDPPSLGSTSAGFPTIYRKPTARILRRKRQVEDYEHYAAVVFDEDGVCHLLSSPSLKRQKRSVLSDAATRAQEVLEGTLVPHRGPDGFVTRSSELDERPAIQAPIAGSISFPFDPKRRRLLLENYNDFHHDGASTPVKLEEATMHDPKGLKSSLTKKDIPFPSKFQAIRVDDTSRWATWYLDGFTSIQQTACRTIAKEWIKAIHPKKQSTHPYNGKMPRSEAGSPDPERTRPPYWPPYIRHKEPDHIDKTDRTALLVYLLMHTSQDEIVPDKVKSEKTFAARDLLAALQKKQDEGVIAKWRIIEELVNAREAVENYEAGGLDGDAVLHVPDWGEVLRAAGSRRKGGGTAHLMHQTEEEDADSLGEEDQAQEDDSMVQISTNAQISARQPFLDTTYNHEQAKALQYPLSSASGLGSSEQQMSVHSQQPPMQMAYADVNTGYSKPQISHEKKAREDTSSSQVQHNLTNDLAPFNHQSWHVGRTDKISQEGGFATMSSFTRPQDIVDSTQFAAAQSLNQLPLAHAMLTNDPYAGADTYSYGMSQPADGGYNFHHLHQYQQLGYNPQYDMDRNFGHT